MNQAVSFGFHLLAESFREEKMKTQTNDSRIVIVDKDGAHDDTLTLTKKELAILADYHYYEAEKAITRRGDRESQHYHLQRLAIMRRIGENTNED